MIGGATKDEAGDYLSPWGSPPGGCGCSSYVCWPGTLRQSALQGKGHRSVNLANVIGQSTLVWH